MSTAALRAVETDEDLARVAELAREIWLEYYPAIIGREQAEYMIATLQNAEAIAAQRAAGMRYFLVEHGAESVGYAGVETREQTLFISKLYLLAAVRGLGLGQQTLQLLAEHAREVGLDRLELTVNRNNTLALEAYARFGMTVVGTSYVQIGNGYAMDDYVLRTELAPPRGL